MTITLELIKRLRQESGAGVWDCRQALEQNEADYAGALRFLQDKAAAQARRQDGRQASQGIVEVYAHNGGRIGVMLEVNCETDFAARSEKFRAFAHALALHVAAAQPQWVADEDVPASVLDEQRSKAASRARAAGKAETLIPRITAGSVHKFMDQHVLLRQPYLYDETLSVGQVLAQVAASTGENVVIRRFVRWELDEERAAE
ncbi:MAG: elongation factor Ts [Chloroflexi bacterium]|jgi:elongation factor Ts|nr:elongation factor Ts [Anaerolineaceae bacterium]NMB88133.1 elongation factor Ts [Chloroflexota bacterium]